MTKAKLQEKLQHFKNDDETISVELYLLFEDDQKKIQTYLPAVEEDKLTVALTDIVRKSIKSKFFIETEGYQYQVVSANTAEADNIRQVYHISKKEIPRANEIFGSAIDNTALELPKKLELEDVWGYIFKVDSFSEGTIFLFKRNYPINVLKKENTYGLIFTNRKLSLFDKDLLRLSKHFDVMLIDNELIILSRTEFEKAFDYVGAMQASASANVSVIKKSKLVEDLEKISLLSQSKSSLRKLLNINPNSKILRKTPKQIVKLAKKYKVKFDLSEDETQLSLTTKKSAIAFVEMLNDDFLKSEFSGSLYKIKGKSII